MQVFWEKIGILGPVYSRVGSGLSDHEIAYDLDITEVRVQECVAWMQHFLRCKDRNELAHEASHARVM
jgi:DNA-binding NarL/FixJ family response regulator